MLTASARLERLITERGAPQLLRCDNGPEMTAHVPCDWCELSKTGTAFIEPGSPRARNSGGIENRPPGRSFRGGRGS